MSVAGSSDELLPPLLGAFLEGPGPPVGLAPLGFDPGGGLAAGSAAASAWPPDPGGASTSVAVDGGGAYSEASWWLALELSCAAGALLGLAIASLTRRLLAWRRCSCVQLPQPRERTDTALGRLLDYSRAGAALLASLALCIRCVDAPGRDLLGERFGTWLGVCLAIIPLALLVQLALMSGSSQRTTTTRGMGLAARDRRRWIVRSAWDASTRSLPLGRRLQQPPLALPPTATTTTTASTSTAVGAPPPHSPTLRRPPRKPRGPSSRLARRALSSSDAEREASTAASPSTAATPTPYARSEWSPSRMEFERDAAEWRSALEAKRKWCEELRDSRCSLESVDEDEQLMMMMVDENEQAQQATTHDESGGDHHRLVYAHLRALEPGACDLGKRKPHAGLAVRRDTTDTATSVTSSSSDESRHAGM